MCIRDRSGLVANLDDGFNRAFADIFDRRESEADAGLDDGEWRGTSELYPRFFPWPAKMSLTVLTATRARLTLSFGGRPEDIVREVALSHEGGVIGFEDPSGPNESVVKYRGVLRGDTIEGVAEFTGTCLLYTSPSPRDRTRSRMPSSA